MFTWLSFQSVLQTPVGGGASRGIEADINSCNVCNARENA